MLLKSILFSPILILTFVCDSTYGQELYSVKHLEGSDTDTPKSIVVDNQGNLFIGGAFMSSLDFDPGTGTDVNYGGAVTNDGFIIKLDPSGNYLWGHGIGGSDPKTEQVNRICTDNSGNIYMTGTFNYSTDFDPGSGSYSLICNGLLDGFLLKFSGDGNFIWARDIGGPGSDNLIEVKTGSNNQVVAIGMFEDSSDFDPLTGVVMDYSYGSNGSKDAVVWSLDTSGNYQWHKTFRGDNVEYPDNLRLSDQNDIYLTLNTTISDSTDINPGTAEEWVYMQNGNYILIKLNSQGDLLWYRQYMHPIHFEIVEDGSEIAVIGKVEEFFDFDEGPNVDSLDYSNNPGFLQYIDTMGQHISVRKFGGSNYDPRKFRLDASNNIYQARSFTNSVSFVDAAFSDDLYSEGYTDIAISKHNSAGDFLFASRLGGVDYDFANDFLLNGDSLVITGTFRDELDFDLSDQGQLLYDPDWIDGFIASYSTCHLTPAIQYDTISAPTVSLPGATYQWLDCSNNMTPVQGETQQTYYGLLGGEYAVEVSYNGCMDTSDCQVFYCSNSSSISWSQSYLLEASPDSGTYQWLDCNNNMSQVIGETGSQFLPAQNGQYAVEVVFDGCVDTSSCFGYYLADMRDNHTSSELDVYPNPFTSIIYLDYTESVPNQIVFNLYNLSGNLVYTEKVALSTNSKVNLDFLSSGFFFYEFTDINGRLIERGKLCKSK